MSEFLGSGDERKGRSLLGGLGEGDTGAVGAVGGVGAFSSGATVEVFARVSSSIASGGTAGGGASGLPDRDGGRRSLTIR